VRQVGRLQELITAFTKFSDVSLSWARSIQSIPPLPTLEVAFCYQPPIYFG